MLEKGEENYTEYAARAVTIDVWIDFACLVDTAITTSCSL